MGNATARQSPRRSPGEGSVYKTGNRWRGRVTWTENDGRQQRRLVSGRTKKEAREKLDELRRQLRIGVPPAAAAGTVGEYLADWIERDRANVRPSTWRSREMHVRVYLIPALGRLQLAKLTARDVERALASFMTEGRPVVAPRGRPLRPISAQSARHVRATLRRALNDAIRDERLGRNAAQLARPPKMDRARVQYLSRDLAYRLLEGTAAAEYGPLYALAASTGLRLGELLGLSWESVDVEARRLSVTRTLARSREGGWTLAEPKSERSTRTIRLNVTALAALAEQRTRQEAARLAAGEIWQDLDRLVFTDAVGRPLDPHRVSSAFQRDREAAGVPRVRFHDLRHTAATLMLSEGVPLAVISDWLGHAGIAITVQHYAAIVPELHDAAAAALDRALAAGHPQ
jgi:integrase